MSEVESAGIDRGIGLAIANAEGESACAIFDDIARAAETGSRDRNITSSVKGCFGGIHDASRESQCAGIGSDRASSAGSDRSGKRVVARDVAQRAATGNARAILGQGFGTYGNAASEL